MKIYYQSWIGNDILNHHKSTVVEVKSKMEGIAVFDLSYFAEYLNVSRNLKVACVFPVVISSEFCMK